MTRIATKIKRARKLLSEQGLSALWIAIWVALARRIRFSLSIRDYDGELHRFNDDDLFRSLNERMPPYADRIAGRPQFILTDRSVHASIVNKVSGVLRSLDDLTDDQISQSVFHIYFSCDSDALPSLRRIRACGGSFLPHGDKSKTSYRFINRAALTALSKTWSARNRVSHLYPGVHENLCEALELTKFIPGDYVEVGVYLGGSALTALHYLRHLEDSGHMTKKAWLIDTFDGFNYPQAETSSDMQWTGTHKLAGAAETIRYVRQTLEMTGTSFELVKSNICDQDLPPEIETISVANIDVDMYEPTLAALKKTAARISSGGIIVVEDAASTPRLYGAYLALIDFLDTPLGGYFVPIFKNSQYFLIRR